VRAYAGVHGRAVDDNQINLPPVRCRDMKSGSLCEYGGGPKMGPLPSQFFRFFIVEMRKFEHKRKGIMRNLSVID
jgi:hypothetical protein